MIRAETRRSGFTVVELLVVIAILGILMAVAFVSMRSIQFAGRNSERKSDAEAISLSLEGYYKQGAADGSRTGAGSYPSTKTIDDALTSLSYNYIQSNVLPDSTAPIFHFSFLDESKYKHNLRVASSRINDASKLTDINYITYEPLRYTGSDWALCTGNDTCTRFRLHYTLETEGGGSGETTTIESKNQ